MAHARPQPAVGSRDDVLAPDDARVLDQALGHQLRVLDEVAGVAHDARNEDLALWQLHVFPHAPLVVVARIGGLDGVGLGPDRQEQPGQITKRKIVLVRAVVAAPADVKAHALGRDVAQRVVERLDP